MAATVVKGYIDYHPYDSLVDLSRFVYTTYVKLVSKWKEKRQNLPLEEWRTQWMLTHHLIPDLAPPLPDATKRQYCQEERDEKWVDAANYKKISAP